MSTKITQKGYGGIETYDFIETSNNINGYTAFMSELSIDKVQDAKNQFTGQQSDLDMSDAEISSVFKRSKKLRQLLSR